MNTFSAHVGSVKALTNNDELLLGRRLSYSRNDKVCEHAPH